MGRNPQHIVAGLEAVIPSAHAVTQYDVWVDVDELPEALRQIRKLRDGIEKPNVYPATKDKSIANSKVCIKL